MLLFPDSVTQTGPCVHCFVKFCPKGVGYMYLGVLYNCIVAILNHSDPAQAFIVTTFPAL